MLPANSAMRIEPVCLVINASLGDSTPLRCDGGFATVYITVCRMGKGGRGASIRKTPMPPCPRGGPMWG
jgi:hypothetical protein